MEGRGSLAGLPGLCVGTGAVQRIAIVGYPDKYPVKADPMEWLLLSHWLKTTKSAPILDELVAV